MQMMDHDDATWGEIMMILNLAHDSCPDLGWSSSHK